MILVILKLKCQDNRSRTKCKFNGLRETLLSKFIYLSVTLSFTHSFIYSLVLSIIRYVCTKRLVNC